MQELLLQLRPGGATLRQGPEQCRCLPDCVQSPFAGPCSQLHSLQHVGTAGDMSRGVARSSAACQPQAAKQVCQTAATGAFTWQPQLVCEPYRSPDRHADNPVLAGGLPSAAMNRTSHIEGWSCWAALKQAAV